jgi:hypothetical protein
MNAIIVVAGAVSFSASTGLGQIFPNFDTEILRTDSCLPDFLFARKRFYAKFLLL